MIKINLLIILLFSSICYADRHIIVFTADWCGPCQRLKSNLNDNEIQKLLKDKNIHYINIDEYPRYSISYGISSIPQVLLVERNNDTKIIERNVGIMSKDEIKSLIRKYNKNE
jgi:thioredoxin-like negative regulator of GroEL